MAEKQITLRNLKGKFSKNIDDKGQPGPFLTFKVDTTSVQTQAAKSKTLFDFFDQQNNRIGQVVFTYVMTQSLKYDYTIQVWQIKAIYDQNFDTFSTMEPFLVFSHEDQKFRTQIVQNVNIGQTIEFKKNKFCFGFNEETQKEQKLKRYKQLKIEGYQDDLTDEQYVGKAYIKFKDLIMESKTEHRKTTQIYGEDEKEIGKVSFSYVINRKKFYPAKSLNPEKQDLPSTRLDIISKQDTLKLLKTSQTYPSEQVSIYDSQEQLQFKVKDKPVEDEPVEDEERQIEQSFNSAKQPDLYLFLFQIQFSFCFHQYFGSIIKISTINFI